MPFYDYQCADHGGFSALRSMAERNAPQPCPRCGTEAGRVLSEPPMRGLLSTLEREAHAANERSAHEPRSLAQMRARHGPGCGCCGSVGGRRGSVTRPDGMKSLVGRRPWQISH